MGKIKKVNDFYLNPEIIHYAADHDLQYLTPREKAMGVTFNFPEIDVNFRIAGKATSDKKSIERDILYASRDGQLTGEDEFGMPVKAEKAAKKIADTWVRHHNGEINAPAVSILYLGSEDYGDHAAFEDAARDWCAKLLKGHQLVMFFHYDSRWAHAHIVYQRWNSSGNRFCLNDIRSNLACETFAKYLLDRGIPANSTVRDTREAGFRKKLKLDRMDETRYFFFAQRFIQELMKSGADDDRWLASRLSAYYERQEAYKRRAVEKTAEDIWRRHLSQSNNQKSPSIPAH